MMNGKRWIEAWLIIIIIIPFIGVFNYLIDPYGLNNFIAIDKVNKDKKSNTTYTLRFKTNIIRNYKFDTLICITLDVTLLLFSFQRINPCANTRYFDCKHLQHYPQVSENHKTFDIIKKQHFLRIRMLY